MDLALPICDILAACPCCGVQASLVTYEIVRDVEGDLARIALCQSCLALFNLAAYSALNDTRADMMQGGDFYNAHGFGGEDHLAAVQNAEDNIVGYFLRRTGFDPNDHVYCEIGIGRGYSSVAATRQFKAVYGLDFDLGNVRRVCGEIGWPANMHIGRSLEEVDEPIDLLVGWHALEHIPQPLAFLKEARGRMTTGSYFFFQVPLFRPEYIVRSHHVFFNEEAMRRLMFNVSANVLEIGFDPDLACLTVIAQIVD